MCARRSETAPPNQSVREGRVGVGRGSKVFCESREARLQCVCARGSGAQGSSPARGAPAARFRRLVRRSVAHDTIGESEGRVRQVTRPGTRCSSEEHDAGVSARGEQVRCRRGDGDDDDVPTRICLSSAEPRSAPTAAGTPAALGAWGRIGGGGQCRAGLVGRGLDRWRAGDLTYPVMCRKQERRAGRDDSKHATPARGKDAERDIDLVEESGLM